jgi:hypothetical protein
MFEDNKLLYIYSMNCVCGGLGCAIKSRGYRNGTITGIHQSIPFVCKLKALISFANPFNRPPNSLQSVFSGTFLTPV